MITLPMGKKFGVDDDYPDGGPNFYLDFAFGGKGIQRGVGFHLVRRVWLGKGGLIILIAGIMNAMMTLPDCHVYHPGVHEDRANFPKGGESMKKSLDMSRWVFERVEALKRGSQGPKRLKMSCWIKIWSRA